MKIFLHCYWFFCFPLYDFAVFFNYFRRIFKNIFNHAEQISQVYLKLSLLLCLGFFEILRLYHICSSFLICWIMRWICFKFINHFEGFSDSSFHCCYFQFPHMKSETVRNVFFCLFHSLNYTLISLTMLSSENIYFYEISVACYCTEYPWTSCKLTCPY